MANYIGVGQAIGGTLLSNQTANRTIQSSLANANTSITSVNTYQNLASTALFVSVSANANASSASIFYVQLGPAVGALSTIIQSQCSNANSTDIQFIVPPGLYYGVAANNVPGTLLYWTELL